ncbi:MAG TPA: hypothetical protein VGH87_01660, partial [Polyangiaceae bacterium]
AASERDEPCGSAESHRAILRQLQGAHGSASSHIGDVTEKRRPLARTESFDETREALDRRRERIRSTQDFRLNT